MYGEFNNVRIAGISTVVPEKEFDNYKHIESVDDSRMKKQVKLTGIRHRHIFAENQKISDMTTLAAKKLMKHLDWDCKDIRALVFVTQTPEILAPSTAMIIQKKLGLSWDCTAFDVNLGCAGFISGIQIVSGLLQGTGGKGILIVGDGKYRDVSGGITKDMLLFGDGVTATAIELAPNNTIKYSQFTDGSRYELFYSPEPGKRIMNGNDVLSFSMDEVCQSICNMKNHYSIEDRMVDYYVFHQSHKMSVEGVAMECKAPLSKVLTCYEEFGNTAGASIPMTLCNNSELLRKKDKVSLLMCGFGIGLAWNVAYLEMSTEAILPIEYSPD